MGFDSVPSILRPYWVRPDLTPYLIHLTRSDDDHSALSNLVNILKAGTIFGTGEKKKGGIESVSFMDVPFIALKYICTEENIKRYEPYGIIVSKTFAYKNNVRPVLYLSSKELNQAVKVPKKEHWRVVSFQKGMVDWAHEREWRCRGDFKLPKEPLGILVKTVEDAATITTRLHKVAKNFKSIPNSIIPLELVCQGLNY